MANNVTVNKGGRAPLIEKGKATIEMRPGMPSPFEIPPEVKNELKNKKLHARWVDMAQLKAKGGYHKNGYMPIQFDCLKGALKNNPFLDAAMDGFLIRNGMVLAVNTEEAVSVRREYKRQRTQIQSGRQASEEFKQHVKSVKGAKVVEDDDSDME